MTKLTSLCAVVLLASPLVGCGAADGSSDPESVAEQEFASWSCPSGWTCYQNLDDKLTIGSLPSGSSSCDSSDYCGGWCTGGCAGSSTTVTPTLSHQTTTTYDGNGAKIVVPSNSSSKYSSALEWVRLPLADTAAQTDTYWRGYWRVYITSYAMNTLEFDVFSANPKASGSDGPTAMWGSHCDFDPGTTDGTCHWKIDAQDGGSCTGWTDPMTGGITSHLAAGQWHTIEWQVAKFANSIRYEALTVDGTQYAVNRDCGYETNNWQRSGIQVQQDQNSVDAGFTEYVDDVAVFHWHG